MTYCRIDLFKTNYKPTTNVILFVDPPIARLQEIYQAYCKHKQFDSVMPIFDSQFRDIKNHCYGYLDNERLAAFSLVRIHDDYNAESLQFAWDYKTPKMRLGIKSLETECALFKTWGFRYLYLGEASDYKRTFDGYEELGSIQ